MQSPDQKRHFASDNNAGFSPEVLEAIQEANSGHVPGYGSDGITAAAKEAICDLFEKECEVFFVFNGTAANSLAVGSFCAAHQSVLCHRFSHMETDECNAPGFLNQGLKTIGLEGPNGKIRPEDLQDALKGRRDIHSTQPRVVSLTNATELGTVYSQNEVAEIGELTRGHDWALHVDGARFANAVASTGCHPADLTWRSGVDVLVFGGTKNGLVMGEAIVFFNPEQAVDFLYRVKQAGQLASKMRFLASQWLGLIPNGKWLQYAQHANAMAERLAAGLVKMPGVVPLFAREANAVFARIPTAATSELHELGWRFYTDVGPGGGARLMCSWDTTPEDVDKFLEDLGICLKRIPIS